MKGNLYVISGPSGVGKDTLVALVFERVDGLQSSVSVTTRKPRPGELEGMEYFFKSKEEVKDLIANGQLLEWNEFAGNIYGTPKSFIDECVNNCKDVLLSIDVNGALNVKKHFPEAKLIFIAPPSIDELKNRLEGRATESKEQISKRLAIANKELVKSAKFDKTIINDKLEKAADELVNYICSKG